MKADFQMTFQHSESTIKRLSQVQYLSFQKLFILLQLILGAFFLYAGYALTNDDVVMILFYFFGGWLLVSWKQIPLFRAEKILRQCKGEFPVTHFSFEGKQIRIENEQIKSALEYSKILRLTQDESYHYLFISREGAYMLPRSRERKEDDAFEEFLSKKTGLNWTPVKSIFSLSLKSLHMEHRNTRGRRLK